MYAQRAVEVHQAAASQANVSRPPRLSETIRPTTNEFALSSRALETREADTMCVETEPKDEGEDTPLVRQSIEVRKSVYGSCSEGLAGTLRKTSPKLHKIALEYPPWVPNWVPREGPVDSRALKGFIRPLRGP